MDLFDLTGRVALVTGGSRGLGREMARACARFGPDVMLASGKQDACDAAAEEIRRTTGRRALGRACHVGRWNELEGLVDAAYEHFGAVDILVNNAGMSPLYPSVDAVTEELWDKVLGVNLKGPFRLTALIGSRMAQKNGGSIINISSGAASRPTPDVIPYAAAKAGLEAMTIGFARAFGPKVRVNAIQAGPFFTDISKAWDLDAFRRRAKAALALQRGGAPSEIVGAAVYLAGLNSSGRLPAAAALPPDGVPERGIGSATVPGAPAGWHALAERFGTRPLRALAEPAIRLAREGVARAPGLARMTEWSRGVLARDVEAARIFLADGPLVQPDLARTLEEIEGFYEGPVARRAPAPFTPADFAAHRAEWVEPRRAPFAGVEVCELPPNSRGHLVLEAIRRLEPLDGLRPEDAEFHLRLIRALRAAAPGGDTIYLCVVD